jgi:hypothetical protein
MQQHPESATHRPRPLPQGRWLMRQRWNDLLFVHWPVPVAAIAPLLPEGLQVDTFQGSAWLGVTPFWMDRMKIRGLPPIFGSRHFPEVSLRTYVRDLQTGTLGAWVFSVEASNLLAVAADCFLYRMPCHWAEMHLEQRTEREFSFDSCRRMSDKPVIFQARYRGLGPTRKLAQTQAGSLESFLMERYCLYSRNRAGQPIRANLHHATWPLEEAEAQIGRNDLFAAAGIEMPEHEPVLHYSRRLTVYFWPAELLRPTLAPRPVTVAATP